MAKGLGEPPMQELARRRTQIEGLIADNGKLRGERDEARKMIKQLMEALRDFAFSGEGGPTKKIAQRTLNRIEKKLEQEGIHV
jgi:predicted RNase H-like nuclease (RuvC/YqgF family)